MGDSRSREADVDPVSAGEDVAGFVVPRWRVVRDGRLDAIDSPVCLAPWRPAPSVVVELLVAKVWVGMSDLVVDLGSGDGRVLVELASRVGCRGVGIEASARLVARSRGVAAAAGVGDRVSFLHELIGSRGLHGATLVYVWLLPGSSELLCSLVGEVLTAGGGDRFRGLVVVGEVGDLSSLGTGGVIGEVPDRGRIRSDAGVQVRWFRCRAGALS